MPLLEIMERNKISKIHSFFFPAEKLSCSTVLMKISYSKSVLPAMSNFGPQATHSNITFVLLFRLNICPLSNEGSHFPSGSLEEVSRGKLYIFTPCMQISCPTIRFYRFMRLKCSKRSFQSPIMECWNQTPEFKTILH